MDVNVAAIFDLTFLIWTFGSTLMRGTLLLSSIRSLVAEYSNDVATMTIARSIQMRRDFGTSVETLELASRQSSI